VPQVGHQSQPPFAVNQSQPPVAVQAVPSQRAQELVAKADKKKSGAAIYVIGTFVALAAVAAGGFLVVKPRLMKAQQATVAVAPKVEEKPATPDVPTTRWQDQIAQNSAPATATAQDTATPNDMEIATPEPNKAAPVAPKKGAPVVANAKKNNKVADELAQAPAPPPPAPATPAPKVESKDGTVASEDALGKAMKTAAGPSDSAKMTTPDDNKPQYAAGSVPQRPSQGAVIGALGAVMPNARACLDADDAVSRATVTFASDGTVKNVAVNGGAKGKPAEACIKGALSHAKVSPFAEESYTTTVTVRH
jgi:hypothetical protein